MRKFVLISAIICSIANPGSIYSGTAQKADKTILLDQVPNQLSKRIEKVSSFDIEYGNDPGASLGFQRGGKETEKLGPNAFKVNQDGTITICDPVHKKVFLLNTTKNNKTKLKAIEPYTFERVSEIQTENPNHAVKVRDTGIDKADIIYPGSPPKSVRIKIDGPLASVRIIGVTAGYDVFVLVERFVELGSLAVTREVIVLNASGELEARLKIDDAPFVPPAREFQLADDGSLYRMIPGDKSVTFRRYEVR